MPQVLPTPATLIAAATAPYRPAGTRGPGMLGFPSWHGHIALRRQAMAEIPRKFDRNLLEGAVRLVRETGKRCAARPPGSR
jgi:hypothetical protein